MPSNETRHLAEIVRDVVSVPTASYRERHVLDAVRAFAEERGLPYAEDRYGNGYVTYRKGPARRPLVLGAHADHPGFVVSEVRGRTLDLEFRGGLSSEYGSAEGLRIYDAGSGADKGGARIVGIRADANARIESARASLERGVSAAHGDYALWDVDVFRVRGEIVRARQCDDLVGCAGILATLDRLVEAGRPGHVIGLFTRAEEVGLRGASVVGRERMLPDGALVVAVETSSMAGGRAVQGGGPIVRVGDAIHVFSPAMTRWMTALAQELQSEDPSFRFQRKLMDGGVTEATSYDLYGYETGAACIALGNYHNAGPRRRVAAETVHLGDLEGLVRLFVRMAETAPRFSRALPDLRKRYDRLAREAAPLLRRSPRAR